MDETIRYSTETSFAEMKHRSSSEKDSQFPIALRGVVQLCVHLFLRGTFISSKQNIMAAEGGAVHNRNRKPTLFWAVRRALSLPVFLSPRQCGP